MRNESLNIARLDRHPVDHIVFYTLKKLNYQEQLNIQHKDSMVVHL